MSPNPRPSPKIDSRGSDSDQSADLSIAGLQLDRSEIAKEGRVVPIGTIDGVRYFTPDRTGARLALKDARECLLVPPKKPLQVAIATSIRDIGADDRCGQYVRIRNSRGDQEEVYMKGAAEHLIQASKGELGKFFQVKLIIIDDVPNSSDKIQYHSILPNEQNSLPWIAPPDLTTPNGDPVQSLVKHLPSSWRKIPLAQHSKRAERKYSYEMQLEQMCGENGADLVLSDHLLIHLEHLHKGAFAGRVLNIHPGITWEGDPEHVCRGLTPTMLAIQKAALCRQNGKTFHTGATLHHVADEMDGGPPICDTLRTPVLDHYDPVTLRYHNYRQSKLFLLEKGLCYYAANQSVLSAP
jgi:hypothetical protein